VQENAIRPFCVGRRNWLFADTVAGANASANLYSLLQTCKVNGIDGYRYLSCRTRLLTLPSRNPPKVDRPCFPATMRSDLYRCA
jgi:transposase